MQFKSYPASSFWVWPTRSNGSATLTFARLPGLTLLLPESPRWIASQRPDDHDGLLDAIARLRDKAPADPEVKEEAADISDHVHGSGRGEVQPLRGLITNRHHRKRLLLAAGAL